VEEALYSLTGYANSPFHAEPIHHHYTFAASVAYQVLEEDFVRGDYPLDLLIRFFASGKLSVMQKSLQKNKLEPPVGLEPTAC
jgi:hypothetical protein